MRPLLHILLSVFMLVALSPPARAQQAPAQEGGDIEDVSLDALLEVPVSAAAKYEQSSREAPASVSVITSDDIERYGYRSLADALNSVPGFYLTSDLTYAYLGTRGFGRLGNLNNRNNRVLFLLNGFTLNEITTGYGYIDQRLGIDLSAVEKIEVVRGPGSALYGTGAMFAVVNIITKDVQTLQSIQAVARTTHPRATEVALMGAHRFGGGPKVAVIGSWGADEGQDLYFSSFDAQKTNHGVAEQRDWSRYYNVGLMTAYKAFSLQGGFVMHEKGDAGAAKGTIFNHAQAKTEERFAFAELKYGRDLSADKHFVMRSYVERARLRDVDPFDPREDALHESSLIPALTLPSYVDLLTVEAWGRSAGAGAEAQFQWDVNPTNRLILGTEQRHARMNVQVLLSMLGGMNMDPLWHHEYAGYVQHEHHVNPHLTATLGLRYSYFVSGDLKAGAALPRAALVYHPFRTSTLKLLYGQAFRIPGVLDRVNRGLANFSENPNLEPERIRTTEVSWEQQLGAHTAASLAFYQYRMHGLIDLVDDPTQGVLQNQNIGRVRSRGLEAEVNARPTSRVHFYASYTLQRARNLVADQRLTNSPMHLVKAGAAGPVSCLFDLGAEARYESRRLARSSVDSEAYTSGFWLVNAQVRTTPLWQRLRLALKLENALDRTYALPGSSLHRQTRLPQYGRRFLFTLSYTSL